MVALFIHLYLTQVDFVSTVLVTDLVVAATFLLVVGGSLLVFAAFKGFVAVVTRHPSTIAAVRHDIVHMFLKRPTFRISACEIFTVNLALLAKHCIISHLTEKRGC